MAKARSEPVREMDALQAVLKPDLKRWGFRSRARGYNRPTSDGLTQVIEFQMGRFDPPGTYVIPGMRENLYGRFTINLGVFVPEVTRYKGVGDAAPAFVREIDCCVRTRIGNLSPEQADLWWSLAPNPSRVDDIRTRLERDGLPFLERFGTRNKILAELATESGDTFARPRRIKSAIILAELGRTDEARELLSAQARESDSPPHTEYVRELAGKLRLGNLDV